LDVIYWIPYVVKYFLKKIKNYDATNSFKALFYAIAEYHGWIKSEADRVVVRLKLARPYFKKETVQKKTLSNDIFNEIFQ